MARQAINNEYISYPKTLSKEELTDLFLRFQSGDLAAKDKIIIHNIGLVKSIVKEKFSKYMIDSDDLISIGTIGLIKAINSFDIKREVAFSTYAYKIIYNEIQKELQKNKNSISAISISNPLLNNSDNKEYTLENTLYSNINLEYDYTEQELHKAINNFIENLNKSEKDILKLYFGFYSVGPITQEQIATKYKTTKANISLIISDLLNRLKYNLEQQNLKEKEKVTKVGKYHNGKARNIYEYFYEHSKKDTDYVLSQLNDYEKKYINLKFNMSFNQIAEVLNISSKEVLSLNAEVIAKMKRLFNLLKTEQNKKLDKRTNMEKNLYQLFPYYKKEEIKCVINSLSQMEQKLLQLKFGENYNSAYSYFKSKYTKFNEAIDLLLNKIKTLLEIKFPFAVNSNVKPNEDNNKTLYDIFFEYSQEEIKSVISHFSERDKLILKIKYGKSYNESYSSANLTFEQLERLITFIKPKLAIELKQKRLNKIVTIEPLYNDKDNEQIPSNMDLSELMPFILSKTLINLTSRQQTILKFKFKMIDGEYHTEQEISEYLHLDLSEVTRNVKTSLLIIKEILDKQFDLAIEKSVIDLKRTIKK